MRITKFGHSCLVVETDGVRFLIDPGAWSDGYTEVVDLNAIFITHEHQDHCDIPSLHTVRQKNPQATLFANEGVGKKLSDASIPFERLIGGESRTIQNVVVKAVGHDHAIIYDTSPCQNTGYLIAGRLYHPGDSLHMTDQPVEILALPVCAPWMKMREAIDFAKAIKPKMCFPIHDGMLKHIGPFHRFPQMVLEEAGIEWRVLESGIALEI